MLIAGLGGFAGTCARYLVGVLAKHLFATAFPVGTLTVNIVGSFIIGLLYGLAERQGLFSGNMTSLLLITGFCGGFTTFSSFADDGFLMLQQRHWMMFLLYFGLSLVLGVLMVWLGRGVVKAL